MANSPAARHARDWGTWSYDRNTSSPPGPQSGELAPGLAALLGTRHPPPRWPRTLGGWHLAEDLQVPANVRLYGLPSCTPELQPAEHLWPLVREALADRDFDHLVGRAAKLRRRCNWLAEHPEVVQGPAGCRWAVNL